MGQIQELQDLLGLWRGDEDSTGFASETLALAILEKLPAQSRPKNVDAFLKQLYPQVEDLDDIDPVARGMVERALACWKKGGK